MWRGVVCVLLLLLASGCYAAAPTPEELEVAKEDINGLWTLLCGMLVFSMQLGFCFLEVGGVRSVNVINIVFKNLGDCAIGGLCFWLVGYGVYSAGGSAFMGVDGNQYFAFAPDPTDADFSGLSDFFLAFTYMTASVTIVSGAVAERISLEAYYTFVLVVTSFVYPVVIHWVWNGEGFLSPTYRLGGNGTLDFAGSIVIHLFGGVAALTGAAIIGPRKLPGIEDVFSAEGQDHVSPHNKFSQAVGTLLLWFGWFAFNAGSVGDFAGASGVAANAMVTTILASSFSVVTCIIVSRLWLGYFDMGHMCNSALTGLVSITAGCAYISPAHAPLIGVIGTFVYFGVYKLRLKLRIDDVLDAGAVHGGGGVWGGIAVGIFSDKDRMLLLLGEEHGYGLFLGGGWAQLGMQLLGIVCVMAWSMAWTAAIFYFCKFTFGLRVTEEMELTGLDITEHKTHSYDYIQKIEAQTQDNERAHQLRQCMLDCITKAREAIASMVDSDEQIAAQRIIGIFEGYEEDYDTHIGPTPKAEVLKPDDAPFTEAVADPKQPF